MDQFFPQLKMEAVPTEIGILVVLLAATVVVYFQIPKSGTSSNNNDKATNHRDLLDSSRPKPQNPKVNVSQAAPKPINDVWEERRKRGIAHAPTVVKQDSQETKKPFGSSYYYAHNSTKNKGGYSDGLKMEDFTMNGPRLLSKGGNSNGVAAATPTISGDGSSAGGAGAGNDQGNDINSERESESDPISVTNHSDRNSKKQILEQLPIRLLVVVNLLLFFLKISHDICGMILEMRLELEPYASIHCRVQPRALPWIGKMPRYRPYRQRSSRGTMGCW